MKLRPPLFQKLLLHWFDQHGRKSLPWQIQKTPYQVWISEIMLQQTQVKTVIPYFERFMQRFPHLTSLANAHEDAVFHLWAGLGYYSRARNVHRAAQIIRDVYANQFPDHLDTLKALPGIGQSTAGAILSIAFQKPTPILDSNVKRVLTRLHGITDPIDGKSTESILWELAAQYTPKKRVAEYTQAMMDLGATVCTRKHPRCESCPFMSGCIAYQRNIVASLPYKKAVRTIPSRSATFLILKKDSHVLLYKRPSRGIWSGLYCLPEIPGEPDLAAIRLFCRAHFQYRVTAYQMLASFRHTFTHYHLHLFPVILAVKPSSFKNREKNIEENIRIWYNLYEAESVGLPKPIQSILRGLQ